MPFMKGKGEAYMPYRSEVCRFGRSRSRLLVLVTLVASVLLLQLATTALAKKSYRYEDDPVRLGFKALEEGNFEEAQSKFDEAIANEHQIYKARFGIGEILYLKGSYAEAEPLYRQAIIEKNKETGSPDYPEANAGLGLVLLRLARQAEAREAFEQALKEKGKLWKAHYGMARIALDEDRLRDAEKHLEKGKKKKGIEENEDLYRYGMALLQYAQGEIKAAEKNALAALNINPNDSNYGTLVAQIYTEQGDATLAIIEFEKVLQQPGLLVRAPVHHDLGVLYQKEKRYTEALAQYQEAVRKDSTYAVAWKDMATLYALATRHKDAAQSFLTYTQLRQDDPDGYLGLAKSALEAGLKRPALDAATEAFALDSLRTEIRLTYARAAFTGNEKPLAQRLYESLPDTTRFEGIDFVRMGQLKLDAGQHDAARDDLFKSIDMDSTQADAYFALGLLYLNTGKPDSTVTYLEKTLEVQPGHPGALVNLGIAWLRQPGEACNAISPLRGAVDVAPTYTSARTMLAMALVNCHTDSLSAAIVEYKAALEQEPENAGALRGLGFCYLRRGDHGQAVRVLRQATSAEPRNADGWTMLGQAQAIGGNTDVAITSFEKALEINPEHPNAKKGLETLQGVQE